MNSRNSEFERKSEDFDGLINSTVSRFSIFYLVASVYTRILC